MAMVRLTAQEIEDFQTVMRAVATATPPPCRQASLVGNAYTQWMIQSGMSQADASRDQEFDAAFFPPAIDLLYGQAVTIFRSGICDSLTALELRQLEEAARWARGGGRFNFQAASFAVGVVGLGVAAWALWGKRR